MEAGIRRARDALRSVSSPSSQLLGLPTGRNTFCLHMCSAHPNMCLRISMLLLPSDWEVECSLEQIRIDGIAASSP